MNPTTSELQLTRNIIQWLNLNGCKVWRVNSGKIKTQDVHGKQRLINMAEKGQSDIQGIHKKTGKFIALEVKLPHRRKYVTQFQQWFLDEIKEAHGISGVVTSPDEALAIIRDYLKSLI